MSSIGLDFFIIQFPVRSNFRRYQHFDADIHGCCCPDSDCLLFHPELLRSNIQTTETDRISDAISDLLTFYRNDNGTVNDPSLFRSKQVSGWSFSIAHQQTEIEFHFHVVDSFWTRRNGSISIKCARIPAS